MADLSDRGTGSQPDHSRLDKTEKKNRVDEAGDESFPASDPPSYPSGTASPSDDAGPERYPGHLDHDEDLDKDDDA
jgi:hypothetical protein